MIIVYSNRAFFESEMRYDLRWRSYHQIKVCHVVDAWPYHRQGRVRGAGADPGLSLGGGAKDYGADPHQSAKREVPLNVPGCSRFLDALSCYIIMSLIFKHSDTKRNT